MKVEMDTRYFARCRARDRGGELNGFNRALAHVARALPHRRSKRQQGGLHIATLA